MSEDPKTSVTNAPELRAQLEFQANCLSGIGASREAMVDKDKYHDQLMTAIEAFVWRSELAAIDLTEVALVDYRLRGQFLAEAGGVCCYIDPDCCDCPENGVVTPDGPLVIQAQWGEKYHDMSPFWYIFGRGRFNTLEQAGVVKEGLTALLYKGEKFFKYPFVDFCGSIFSGFHHSWFTYYVPELCLLHGRPWLTCVTDYDFRRFINEDSGHGSVSRGK